MPHVPLIRLISPANVVTHAFHDTTFNKTLIKDYVIEVAQERYIKPVLTKKLYDEIITQIQPSGTVTALNQTLIDIIEPALAFFVKAEIMPDVMAQLTSKGLMLNNTEFSASATDKQRADLRSNTFDQADVLLSKLTEHLNDTDNIDDYPLYQQEGVNVDNQFDRLGDIPI